MTVIAVTHSMLRHGARSVRSGGLPFFFAVMMTALGIFSLGAYLSLVGSFQRVASTVGESVAAVAFLDVESASAAEEIRARIALSPLVTGARLVTPEEALARAKRGLGDAGRALEGSAGLKMPWVVEIDPRAGAREELQAFLLGIPGVDEVMHPAGELARVDALMDLLHGAGAFLGLLIALVVVVVVSGATRLSVLSRRDEIAIMKLVGATDLFVRVPFILAGLVQGVLGASAGLLALWAAHTSLSSMAKLALSGALSTFNLQSLPAAYAFGLLVAGALLGVVGSALSVGRFLRV